MAPAPYFEIYQMPAFLIETVLEALTASLSRIDPSCTAADGENASSECDHPGDDIYANF